MSPASGVKFWWWRRKQVTFSISRKSPYNINPMMTAISANHNIITFTHSIRKYLAYSANGQMTETFREFYMQHIICNILNVPY